MFIWQHAPMMHNHDTNETFICMTGTWRASWEEESGNEQHVDLQPLASSYFCRLDPGHITLDWASHESDQPHVVVDCGQYVDEATYEQCLSFIHNPRYVNGDHKSLRSCEDLVFDFTEYTDKDVCLGYTKRIDFRHEEQKRGLDCDAWFDAHDEFAGHVYRLFGATVDQVRNVHYETYGTNLYEEFQKIFSKILKDF